MSARTSSIDDLLAEYDAVVLAGGAEWPRNLDVTGRELDGIHFAMDFLTQQNKRDAGDDEATAAPFGTISAKGKHVVVIGGGDTGSDCIGTSARQGAASITQIEILPKPPVKENKAMVWPDWPTKLRSSHAHEEGCERDWAVLTKNAVGANGQGHGAGLRAGRVGKHPGRPHGDEGSPRQRVPAQGRSGAAGDGLPGAAARGAAGAGGGRRWTRAATCWRTRFSTGRRATSCSPPATCGAASRWWSGRSARAGNAPGRWTCS